jgi:MoxR-like ATPase
MLEAHQSVSPLAGIRPATTAAGIAAMMGQVRRVYVSPAVKEYTVAIGAATRTHQHLRLGASPRALLQLLRAAKAGAALEGRDFVLPDDITSMADAVLSHRLMLDRRAASAGETASSVVRSVLAKVPVARDGSRARAR